MKYFHDIFVHDARSSDTQKVIGLMADQAHLSTRGEDSEWKLEWCDCTITVWFTRASDRRHFENTMEVQHAEFLRQHAYVY